MNERLIKLKPEKVYTSGGKAYYVEFYDREFYSPRKKKYIKEMVVVKVKDLDYKNKYFTAGKSKTELLRRLPGLLDNRERINLEDKSVKKYSNSPKRLYYYKIIRDNHRYYGGRNITAEVFKHRAQGLVKLGELNWTTASYKGEESEVLDFLISKGEVPKDMFPTGYYRRSDAEKMNIKISKL